MKIKASNLNTTFSFAQKKTEAEPLYSKFKALDPLPDIQAALLNSADIVEYISLTGMIFPFNPEKLKPAGYEAKIGNEIWYWGNEKEHHKEELKENDNICFRKNSITYISLKETFLIPDYIALRFNLTITHVHRGLLLGTGPLIDPGFKGKIMIPIHNLTPNDYIVRPGDDIISIEFTKVSPNSRWHNGKKKEKGDYVSNSMKGFPSFIKYFKKALPDGVDSVDSSIGKIIRESETKIKHIKWFAWGTAATIALTLLGIIGPLFYYTWQSYHSSNVYVTNAEQYVIEANNKFNNKFEETVNQNITSLTENRINEAVERIYFNDKELDKRINEAMKRTINELQYDELLKQLREVTKKNIELQTSISKYQYSEVIKNGKK